MGIIESGKQKFNLSMVDGLIQEVYATQLDSSRILEFKTFNNGQVVDLTGINIRLDIAEGSKFAAASGVITFAKDGLFEINLSQLQLQQSGKHFAQIVMTQGDKRISSPLFAIIIGESIAMGGLSGLPENTVVADFLSIMEFMKKIEQYNTLIENLNKTITATANTVANQTLETKGYYNYVLSKYNEFKTVIDNEILRVTSESQRVATFNNQIRSLSGFIRPNLANGTNENWTDITKRQPYGYYTLPITFETNDLKEGEYITISFLFKSEGVTDDTSIVNKSFGATLKGDQPTLPTGVWPGAIISSKKMTLDDFNKIYFYYDTIQITSEHVKNSIFTVNILIRGWNATSFLIRNFKIERGSTATPYILSSYDISKKTGTSFIPESYYLKSDVDNLFYKKIDVDNNFYKKMEVDNRVKVVSDAEILDRQDINRLNKEITGESSLLDANNTKFAQLIGVDISVIKGGIV